MAIPYGRVASAYSKWQRDVRNEAEAPAEAFALRPGNSGYVEGELWDPSTFAVSL